VVVDGRHRVTAMKELGETSIPAYILKPDIPTDQLFLLGTSANEVRSEFVPETIWDRIVQVKMASALLEGRIGKTPNHAEIAAFLQDDDVQVLSEGEKAKKATSGAGGVSQTLGIASVLALSYGHMTD